MNLEALTTKPIVRLSQITINRIAAGEVVERPASVVKELVENALDAEATEISISIEAGGKGLISVSDNGCGMDSENLSLAVENHTTSKLKGDDLLNINSLGFRGEAIASIGSVSELTIKSRSKHLPDGAQISVICGKKTDVRPTPRDVGTTVEIRNLFCATPARLKFLRTDRTEQQYIENIINKIAIANSKVAFKFFHNGKLVLDYKIGPSKADRIADVLGKEFFENSIAIEGFSGDMHIQGHISLPTHISTYNEQYLYINGRAIRDRLLMVYIKTAYQDFIGHEKTPMTVLFLQCPAELVDVNVHPAKAEVRFRDIQTVKDLVIGTLKQALIKNSSQVSTTVSGSAIDLMIDKAEKTFGSFYEPWNKKIDANFNEKVTTLAEPSFMPFAPSKPAFVQESFFENASRFGFAKTQLYNRFIISQSADKVFIVDQHAAHERIYYEQLKKQIKTNSIPIQILAVPEVIAIDNKDLRERLLNLKDKLLGLKIEEDSDNSVKVIATPQLLKGSDLKELVAALIQNLADLEDEANAEAFLNKILATYACYASVRGGRALSIDEMNALLRLMEQFPCTGSCNHGRPTYIELSLQDMKKMFDK